MRNLLTTSILALAVAGCGENARICAPGATQPCFCSGGYYGVQVCAENGETWMTCDCKSPLPRDGGTDRKLLDDLTMLPRKTGPVWLDQALVKPTTPACKDHSSEPNNSGATATKIISQGLLTGWEICYMFDIDQYHFTVDAADVGKTLTIKVEFRHDSGDVEAALLGPTGATIAVSRSNTDNETVATPTGGAVKGTYTLGVWSMCCDQTSSSNKSGAAIPYDLNISLD
jgi:hypothetical protein